MIVSGSLQPARGQVVLQTDHAALAHQMALAFGNRDFEAPEPRDLMEFLALHHDRGWDETDRTIGRNPRTGLPYSLVNTPLDELLRTGPRSVAFNAAHDPYCGLLCSMHVWGLFNGRYGLSDKIVVDILQGEAKQRAERMLQEIIEQQAELKRKVGAKAYAAEDRLMQNYKILQFFDTFSLYFNESAGQDNQPTRFLNVPMDRERVTTIEVKPLGDKTFHLSPYPFDKDGLEMQQRVYEIPVLDTDVEYIKVFQETPMRTETLTLVA